MATERRESRNLTALCGVRLTPDEFERGTAFAKVHGMTLPSLLRSMLLDVLNDAEVTDDGEVLADGD